MPEAIPTALSMELAEFFAKVVLEAFDGVQMALRMQQERQAELISAVSLDPAEFARQTVSQEEVEAELARLFPGSEAARQPHGVFVGAPYQPAIKAGEVEAPSFQALLGVELERADYVKPRESEGFVLSKRGVEKIREAARTKLGAAAQAVLRGAAARGIPRLVVDSGKVSAKLSLSLEQTVAPTINRPIVPLKQAKLVVRMVDDRAPQVQQLKVDIISGLEVTFKTVT